MFQYHFTNILSYSIQNKRLIFQVLKNQGVAILFSMCIYDVVIQTHNIKTESDTS